MVQVCHLIFFSNSVANCSPIATTRSVGNTVFEGKTVQMRCDGQLSNVIFLHKRGNVDVAKVVVRQRDFAQILAGFCLEESEEGVEKKFTKMEPFEIQKDQVGGGKHIQEQELIFFRESETREIQLIHVRALGQSPDHRADIAALGETRNISQLQSLDGHRR
jgi:hypothetical protein